MWVTRTRAQAIGGLRSAIDVLSDRGGMGLTFNFSTYQLTGARCASPSNAGAPTVLPVLTGSEKP